MASTTATWLANRTGPWTASGNWSGGVVPGLDTGSTTAALFTGGSASYTVTLATGTIVNVDTSSASSGIALQVNDQYATLNLSGSLTSGAAGHAITELNAGTIDVESGGLLAVANTFTQTGGVLNVESSGTFTIGKNQGVSATMSAGTIDVSGGIVTTTGNLNPSGGTIDVSSGTVTVASAASLNQTGGAILIGDGTIETGNLTQTGATIGFNASGGLLQFGIGGTTINVSMGAYGVADTVEVTSNSKLGNLTLGSFLAGDVLEVETTGALSNGAIAYSGSDSAGTLTITGTIANSGSFSDVVHITTPGAVTPTSGKFLLSSGSNYFEITSNVVCFVRGTRILTATGERPVESLIQGDIVITRSGATTIERPVKWLGRRSLGIASHPKPETVAPVRIQQGAFAENMPHTDLLVSPDHAIFVDGMLICARQLINGATIRQEKGWTSVEYFHVELDAHAILLAEGLPAESYLDTGNRGFFVSSEEPLVLHPDLTNEADYPTRETQSCAPFVYDEGSVHPVWQRLAERAASLGRALPQLDTTTDPKLWIIAKGVKLRPTHANGDRYIFVLPRDVSEVRLVSSANVPTDVRPWLEDRRCLGVYVHQIVLRNADGAQDIPLDHPNLSQGWWAVEQDGATMRRWTNGDAMLPLPPCADPSMLEIRASSSGMIYAVSASQERRAA